MIVSTLIAMSSLQVSLQPSSRLSEAWWKERHEACVATTQKKGFRLAFLGDSITQGWEGSGKNAWVENFQPYGAANFGFSGDRTEHVLWRLDNGELIAAKPRLVVMMIGTNNLGHGSSNADQTAAGVRAIIAKIQAGSPETKILALGIFPRGRMANDRLRMAVADATKGFQSLHDGKRVHFLDIGKHFVRANGDLRESLMPDLLHLNADGYGIWAKAISGEVKRLMGD